MEKEQSPLAATTPYMNKRAMQPIQMSVLMLALVLSGSALVAPSVAQSCLHSGKPSWNENVRNVVADCVFEKASPDGRYVLRIDAGGNVSVVGNLLNWRGPKIIPPAMVSWSPKSDAFLLNDGDGSGQSSTFRFFRRRKGAFFEDVIMQRNALQAFRRKMKCPLTAIDPNVWGFGWSADGASVYVLIQPSRDNSCVTSEDFISVIFRASDGAAVAALSKKETKSKFGPLLPRSLIQN